MLDKKKNIFIGSDHAGYNLKEYLKQYFDKKGIIYYDMGTYSCASIDYPDIAHPLAEKVSESDDNYGVLICGSGNGMAMAANKHKKIRAALCWNKEITKLAREHNNANILVLPGRYLDFLNAVDLFNIFFSTEFEGGRHINRINKI